MSRAYSSNLRPDGVRIVVFDLGGVVVRICRDIKEAAARIGVAVDDSLLAPDLRARRRAEHARYERGEVSCDSFFQSIAATTGGALSPAQFRALHDAWLIDEYPGVDGLIDELHGSGIHTGVLSNTNQRHWDLMHAGGFPTVLMPRHRHASHLLRLAKPDEAVFRAFESRSGFAPGEILFFDDLEANIAGARAAGWQAHRIDPLGDTAAQMRAALTFPSGPPPACAPRAPRA